MTTGETDLEKLASEDAADFACRLALAFRTAHQTLYLVGGAVRDMALGQVDVDLDFATSAKPEETATIMEGLTGRSPYRVGEKFGTIGQRFGDRLVEITTYRSDERYSPGSRKPDVTFGATLDQDLARRDFTINAMARDPIAGETIDLFGGMQDLAAGLIRAVGEPQERFAEDPLRLLRAIRLASRLGFDIDTPTWQGLLASAHTLDQISRERIRDELSRMLEGPEPARALTLMRDGGLLEHAVPQLMELAAMPDHGPNHPLSLWDHTMAVVQAVPAVLAVRWAAVLHDIGKPATRTHEPSGRPRFFHHEEVGAEMARNILTSLRYSNQMIEKVVVLVETHMQLHAYSGEWSDGAVRRLMVRLGPQTREAVELARADAAGHALGGISHNSSKFDALELRVRALGEEQEARLRSPLTGEDLMARYGRGPGPWIRDVKNTICEALMDGTLQPGDVEGAWRIADAVLAPAGS